MVNMQPPDYLIRKGVHSLPCIGDGRQSGTSASPSILNASHEAAAGGGLALLQSGDRVRIDLKARSVDVLVDDEELIVGGLLDLYEIGHLRDFANAAEGFANLATAVERGSHTRSYLSLECPGGKFPKTRPSAVGSWEICPLVFGGAPVPQKCQPLVPLAPDL